MGAGVLWGEGDFELLSREMTSEEGIVFSSNMGLNSSSFLKVLEKFISICPLKSFYIINVGFLM